MRFQLLLSSEKSGFKVSSKKLFFFEITFAQTLLLHGGTHIYRYSKVNPLRSSIEDT